MDERAKEGAREGASEGAREGGRGRRVSLSLTYHVHCRDLGHARVEPLCGPPEHGLAPVPELPLQRESNLWSIKVDEPDLTRDAHRLRLFVATEHAGQWGVVYGQSGVVCG